MEQQSFFSAEECGFFSTQSKALSGHGAFSTDLQAGPPDVPPLSCLAQALGADAVGGSAYPGGAPADGGALLVLDGHQVSGGAGRSHQPRHPGEPGRGSPAEPHLQFLARSSSAPLVRLLCFGGLSAAALHFPRKERTERASSVQALEPLQKRALEQLAEDLEERTPHGAWHVRICRAAETAELLSPTHPSSDRENELSELLSQRLDTGSLSPRALLLAADALASSAEEGIASLCHAVFPLRWVEAPRATMAATTLRVTTLSGKQVTLQKTLDEPLQLLRREVSEALGVPQWKLQLLLNGDVLKDGLLQDLVPMSHRPVAEGPGEGTDPLELSALVTENAEVVKLSKDLRNAFTVICQPRRRLSRRQLYVIDRHVVKLHEKSILLGDVDFQCEGDNLLELLIWNCPVEDILWVMPLLLQGGCPVNVPSATGAVPLVTACKRGLGQANLVKVGQILLQQGADPFATWHGEDALDCALYYLYRCQCRRGLRRSHGVRGNRCATDAEDLEMLRLCLALRTARLERRCESSPLERARAQLSDAAVGMCLFAPRGAMLSREKVLERSGVQNTFGDALWAG
ncbi:Uncharacterized protein SCF082_LOCUS8133 [Durusdinium trenchii]|uniref:Ubiquitin-like domain-containing protein n=1 Tax=Durusdinium trenchii TaxID=1381693 RepID=A0ABP0IP13_9DINO